MLKGKNVVITGCNRGIGKAILEACCASGANIWACVRSQSKENVVYLQGLKERFQVEIEPVYFDLNEEEQIKKGASQILKSKKKVDAIINVAGITGPNRMFSMTTFSEIEEVFNINFFMPMYFTQKLLKNMMRNKSGSIINIASIAAIDGDPAQFEYVSSKAALIGATKKLSNELGQFGIRVNAVAPGIVDTDMVHDMKDDLKEKTIDMVALKRMGKPEEIASVAVFLASDLSSYISGQTIRVDGGKK